ncbi:thioredoxin family protein [Halobaculum sp. CBA1158]|uniref:thioredoxin family protein n=1 Tax=Halobaculum sp. CBA1158 TaxID=2904243 RepID=UPI001F39E8E4|nr:thioredoxin family protein [Halobaculum sp. CBA1158]UIP01144.1 thioredoxin family protein [Halobaculum sp. CBA1158]
MSDTSATAGGDAAATTTPAPRDVDAREFPGELREAVAEHDLVLVDFYTKGCTLCQSIEPVLGSVARAADVPVLLVNPQTDPSLVSEHSIRSVPTLALFRAGSDERESKTDRGTERPEGGDEGGPREVGRIADGFVGAERIVEFVEDARATADS